MAAQIALHSDVKQAVPFARFDTLILRGADIETAGGVGVHPALFAASGQFRAAITEAAYADFSARNDGLLLGVSLARRLGAEPGDRVTLIVPGDRGNTAPRHQVVTLSGVLNTGTELDEAVALVALPLASQLAGLDGAVSGFRVQTHSLFGARRTGWELSSMLPAGYYSTN